MANKMAERREELSPVSPSKRPRLELDESIPDACDSQERRTPGVSTGSDPASNNGPSDGIPESNGGPSSTSDCVEGSLAQFGSASGAVFEFQGTGGAGPSKDQAPALTSTNVPNVAVGNNEPGEADQNMEGMYFY